MEKLVAIYNWVMMNGPIIVGVLFGISEALALIPAVRANSVAQLIYNTLKSIKDKLKLPAA